MLVAAGTLPLAPTVAVFFLRFRPPREPRRVRFFGTAAASRRRRPRLAFGLELDLDLFDLGVDGLELVARSPPRRSPVSTALRDRRPARTRRLLGLRLGGQRLVELVDRGEQLGPGERRP